MVKPLAFNIVEIFEITETTRSNLVKLTVEKFGDYSIRARPKTIFQMTTQVRGKGQRDNV